MDEKDLENESQTNESNGQPEEPTEPTPESSDAEQAEKAGPTAEELKRLGDLKVWTGYITEVAVGHPHFTADDFYAEARNWHARHGISEGEYFDFPFDPANPPRATDPNAEEAKAE